MDYSFLRNNDLIEASLSTRRFVRENSNIIFTKADKSNVTVALDKNIYLSKMTTLLADNNTYLIVKMNLTRKIINNMVNLRTRR